MIENKKAQTNIALLKWYRTQALFERTIKIIGANTVPKNKIKNMLIISLFNIFFY